MFVIKGASQTIVVVAFFVGQMHFSMCHDGWASETLSLTIGHGCGFILFLNKSLKVDFEYSNVFKWEFKFGCQISDS